MMLTSLLGLGASADIEIELDGNDTRKMTTIKDKNDNLSRAFIYHDKESVTGKVAIYLKNNKSIDHQGIRVDLIGIIENFYDKTQNLQFLTLSRELEPPGTLPDNATYDFAFNNVEMEYESYCGISVRLRYFIQVTINRSYSKIKEEEEFVVFNPTTEPESNAKLRMEVGIEECLHIEFEYQSSKYTLKDVVVGNVFFNLVRIKIKQMELAIVRKETVGVGQNSETQKETLGKFEVMDGAPVKGERIPIRYYLAGVDLTPTYTNVNNRFSTKYFLSLILIDNEDRRYFKEQEIILWRDQI